MVSYMSRRVPVRLGLTLSHDVWFPPPLSGAHAGIPALRATSTATLRLISTRIVRFWVVPSIANDGIDGYNLDLTRIVEGLHMYPGSGLRIALEHYHKWGITVGFLSVFFVKVGVTRVWGGVELEVTGGK